MSAKPDEPKTILQVLPGLHTGGAERTAIDISQTIVDRGWRSIIASSGGRMVPEVEAHGAVHIQMPVDSKNPLTIWRNAQRLKKLITEKNVDLIHARSRSPAWSCLWAAWAKKIPFVTTYHGAYSQSNAVKAYYNSVMARADVVIANSNWTADLIRSRNPWADGRIQTVYRGTNFEDFNTDTIDAERLAKLRNDWGLKVDDFVVLQLARLTEWKGQRVVIDCAAKIAPHYPQTRFVLAGDPQGREDYVASLKSSVEAHGIAANLSMPGHCDDPAAAMALADVVIVASIDAEAFGRAAVEASAFEKPLIVTDIGAVVETVLCPPAVDESERTGWKVLAGDADAMAQALQALLDMDDAERQRVGRNARNYVVANFSLERMCRETLGIYEKLLDTA
ncbi:glycosyltransferase family 4 protein [Pseudahrensia aquimaris]|uniref:Glycosyltransferase family 4 protein n=1 Tax=Pseudahrensia aquimaris TaxID=744461 RepID=A0ABW3FE56_9HYPH